MFVKTNFGPLRDWLTFAAESADSELVLINSLAIHRVWTIFQRFFFWYWNFVLIWCSFFSWFRIRFQTILGCTWTLYMTKKLVSASLRNFVVTWTLPNCIIPNQCGTYTVLVRLWDTNFIVKRKLKLPVPFRGSLKLSVVWEFPVWYFHFKMVSFTVVRIHGSKWPPITSAFHRPLFNSPVNSLQ